MARKHKSTSSAVDIIHRRYFAGKPQRIEELEEERANADIARRLRALREKARMTQNQLAEAIGTTPSVISRLEDAEYEGHSLSMLRRVAAALHKRIEIRFVSDEEGRQHV